MVTMCPHIVKCKDLIGTRRMEAIVCNAYCGELWVRQLSAGRCVHCGHDVLYSFYTCSSLSLSPGSGTGDRINFAVILLKFGFRINSVVNPFARWA